MAFHNQWTLASKEKTMPFQVENEQRWRSSATIFPAPLAWGSKTIWFNKNSTWTLANSMFEDSWNLDSIRKPVLGRCTDFDVAWTSELKLVLRYQSKVLLAIRLSSRWRDQWLLSIETLETYRDLSHHAQIGWWSLLLGKIVGKPPPKSHSWW